MYVHFLENISMIYLIFWDNANRFEGTKSSKSFHFPTQEYKYLKDLLDQEQPTCLNEEAATAMKRRMKNSRREKEFLGFMKGYTTSSMFSSSYQEK